jgi:hypothetical protein
MLDTGFWILDARYWMLETRFVMSSRPGTGSRFGKGIFAVVGKIVDLRYWMLDIKNAIR